LRNALLYRPDDPNHLLQQVPQMHVKGLGVERIKGYRYPAPGSQAPPNIPTREHTDDHYNVGNFCKNTRYLKLEVSDSSNNEFL